MYYTQKIPTILHNLTRICACNHLSTIADLSLPTLKTAYHRFLTPISVFDHLDWNTPKIGLFDDLQTLAPTFYTAKKHFFVTHPTHIQEKLAGGFFDRAFLTLQQQEPTLFALAQCIIKVIVVHPLLQYTNGTTKDTLGLACFDFKDHFTTQDFIELVVHQLTHMLLFIDDRLHPHATKEDKERLLDVGLVSKLGGTQFPWYIAFHSYLVGVEVLCFRTAVNLPEYSPYHGNTTRIIQVCQHFEQALSPIMSCFSARGQTLFYQAVRTFEEVAICHL